nr:hypothetical protein [Bradyrhizobium sp. sBnM-33]
MLKDGTYAAWFKTPLGQGAGSAHVADGKISGRDTIMSYSGTCEVNGERFAAILTLKRHTEGHATVFGADDLTLKLEGTCSGKIARYVGTAEQVPGVLLEGTQRRAASRTSAEHAAAYVQPRQAPETADAPPLNAGCETPNECLICRSIDMAASVVRSWLRRERLVDHECKSFVASRASFAKRNLV